MGTDRVIGCAAVLVGAAVMLAGCGRDGDTSGGKARRTAPQTAAQKASAPEPAPDEGEETGKKEQKEGKGQPEKVELEVDMPTPTFAGTPSDLKTGHLEPNGGPRGKVLVPEGTDLLSKGRPVSASSEPVMGSLERVTDGVKEAGAGKYVTLPQNKQWVQIDLEDTCRLDAVLLWHYHASARVYHDVVVQASTDPDFQENVTTLFNNDYDNSLGLGQGEDYEYVDDFEGKLVKADGLEARYVRVYGNGSTANEMNHFTEVTVYGRPLQD